MPAKKPKTKAKAKAITLRFTGPEIEPIELDRREIVGAGVPAKIGAYAKHAVMSYPRLRKLEALIRGCAANQHSPAREWAVNALDVSR